MKFTCNKETLIKEILAAQKIITQKNQITIISNVLLECDDDKLIIKATDAKLRFETEIPVICHTPGKIALFCDRFAQILKALPAGDLNIDAQEEKVSISILKYPAIHYELRYQNPENFPWSEDPQSDEFFHFTKKSFIQMINNTIFAVSDDEMRLFLNGVYFEKVENELIMVATDGKRLSYIAQTLEEEIDAFEGIIIPPKFLQLIKDLSYGVEGEVAIAIKDQHIYARFDGVKIASSLIDGQFPAYRRAIPEKQEYQLLADRHEFIEAVKRMTIMADSKAKRIYMTIEEGAIKFHVEESKMGKASDSIACEYTGPTMPFAFNFEHLLTPLRVMESEQVSFAFTHTDKAITLASQPAENFFHVIMSMQLDNNT
ncbi:DNA polymerase III subunit beta [Entomospira culicis]|uniref:Beta sliding clamp n=1 Tax=Entomospira culicis TaxID=2719989 RepID=A0A968L086_9SPIO|nr:DNA polymerase III subunit beta [Entomospira culicis]NIZ19872.1 DNA polymerase III subunit beta [Entomospira culicis]NIZ70086.1 DNA polymerase III subunit beta [Entomospira culicis]WDI37190.1 DNA polymerase III subunit beta [Entomospira culicis]WDI38819.1 DNA polymerase III subunit beta [Entomospira culicis]